MTRRPPSGTDATSDDAHGETLAGDDTSGPAAHAATLASGSGSTSPSDSGTKPPNIAHASTIVSTSGSKTPSDAHAATIASSGGETLASISSEAYSATVTPAEAGVDPSLISGDRRRPVPGELPAIDRATYAVRRELARGGMGRILVADDSRLGRRVALKELITKDRGLAKRFSREVWITARLQHPGIVPVYEAGHWPDGEPFYAMKLVAGRSLEKVVESRPTLGERLRLVPNLVQLCEAIAYAHANGIIHRDLKPANVLVGDFGETVVIDWGLAKETDEADDDTARISVPEVGPGLTIHGAVVGTPAYMPPEQATGSTVDARADVYSLGALMWHVLAGRPPYDGPVNTVLEAVRTTAPPALTELEPDVPSELASIVEHAMARDPEQRYPSARELAEDLSRFQAGQLVVKHRYTSAQLVKRWIKKHRALVASSAALVVGAGVVGAIAMKQVVTERDRARAVSLAAIEEQGRRELVDGHPQRAAVYLSAAYRGGRSGESLRLMLGEAMRSVDATLDAWTADAWIKHLAWTGAGQLFAIADDGAITFWDLATGTRTPVAGDAVAPETVTTSRDGSRLVVLGETAVRIVDTATRTAKTIKLGMFFPRSASISPGGDLIAIRGTTGVRIYTPDGTERPLVVDGATTSPFDASIQAIAFSGPNTLVGLAGQRVITYHFTSTGGTTSERTLAAPAHQALLCGDQPIVTIEAPGAPPQLARVNGAGQTVTLGPGLLQGAYCGEKATVVEAWETDTGSTLGTTPFFVAGETEARPLGIFDERAALLEDTAREGTLYTTSALDRAGQRFAAGTATGLVRIWDVSTGLLLASFDGHTRGVRGLAFDPSGTRLASAGDDGTVRLWSLDAPWLTLPPATPPKTELAARSDDGKVEARAVLNDVTVAGRSMRGQEELVTWLDLSTNGGLVVAGARDGRVLRWDASSGRVTGDWPQASSITAGSISKLGTIAFGTRDGSVRIVRDGKDPVVLNGHATSVHSLEWEPSRDRLLSSADVAVRVWNANGSLERYLSDSAHVGHAWWSPSGQWILADAEDGLQVWDSQRGALVARIPHGLSPLATAPILGKIFGAERRDGGAARLGATGFVPIELPRESRDAKTIESLVAARVPWKLTGGELVPTSSLTAMRTDESLMRKRTIYDFSGDTIESAPSTPSMPLVATTTSVAKALDAIRATDLAGARAALATFANTKEPRAAYAAAWCWHWLGEDAVAYPAALRALDVWQDAATRPAVERDVLRMAAWDGAEPDKVLEAFGTKVDDRLRLALAQAYQGVGKSDLAFKTLSTIKTTADWVIRIQSLQMLAYRAYFDGDLTSAVEHIEVAVRAIPAGKMPPVTMGKTCGDAPPLSSTVVATDEASALAALGILTHGLAAESYRTYGKVYDNRYALTSRRLYALLGERFSMPRPQIEECGRELDAMAAASHGQVGRVDKRGFRGAVQRQASALEVCYQRELDSDPTFTASVDIRFELSTSGQVSSIETFPSPISPATQRLADCTKAAMNHLGLPRQMSTSASIVSYPLRFARAAQPSTP